MNAHVIQQSRLPPIKLLRNGLQTFYSKKNVVDVVTQIQDFLRSSTSCPDWEHKVLILILKILVINAFQSYRLEGSNFNADNELNGLDEVITKTNRVETFGGFIENSTFQLISYADYLNDTKSQLQSAVVSAAFNATTHGARQITLQIQKNKRRKFDFFNDGQGKRLCLRINSQELMLADSRWSAYCGQFYIRSTGRR